MMPQEGQSCRCDEFDASSVRLLMERARTSKLFNLLLRVSPFLDGLCLASIIVLLQRSSRVLPVCVYVYICVYCLTSIIISVCACVC